MHDHLSGFTTSRGRLLRRTTWLLMAARAVRSIGQGAMVVDFALYLRALHWSAVAISFVLGAALIFGAMLTLLVGPLSDRIGRRRFLLAFEALQMLASLVALASTAPWLLGIAGVVGGFGRGGNGAAGPFAPVEQAWLAQSVSRADRGRIFSFNSAGGFIGMGVGALLAAMPEHLGGVLPGPLAYRPLFALTLACAVACFLLCRLSHDTEAGPPPPPVAPPAKERATRRAENVRMRRLVLANALNGTGVGLIGPLIAYWFAVRFGVGPARIGPMMAAGFALSAVASVGTGWIGRHIGVVRAIIAMRMVGLALLVGLPLAPGFTIAAVLYVLRGIFNRGTAGARAAVSVSLVRGRRRGLAVSAGNVAMQVPRGLAPVFAGAMFQAGLLELPFFLGAAFQAGYLLVYGWSFRDQDPNREPRRRPAADHGI